jgi:4-carboxymuconolactone decarboxylase
MSDDRTKRGLEIIGKLTGGVRPDGAAGALPKRLMDNTVNFVFGELWAGDDLSLQERSMITCATLIALNRQNEMKQHFAGARNSGIPRAKIEAIITHLAAYAGWPCAVTAAHVLNEVWPEA